MELRPCDGSLISLFLLSRLLLAHLDWSFPYPSAIGCDPHGSVDSQRRQHKATACNYQEKAQAHMKNPMQAVMRFFQQQHCITPLSISTPMTQFDKITPFSPFLREP
jgi:hypothetical protein